MPGSASQHVVAVARIHQNLGDVLAVFQPNVRPVLPAIRRLVNPVAHRHTIARPRLARPHPNNFRVRRIDRHRANRLHIFPVEYRLVGRAAVHRLPHSAACRAHKHRDAAVFLHRVQCGNAPAHRGRADVPRRQSRNRRRIKAVRSLRSRLQWRAQQRSGQQRSHSPGTTNGCIHVYESFSSK